MLRRLIVRRAHVLLSFFITSNAFLFRCSWTQHCIQSHSGRARARAWRRFAQIGAQRRPPPRWRVHRLRARGHPRQTLPAPRRPPVRAGVMQHERAAGRRVGRCAGRRVAVPAAARPRAFCASAFDHIASATGSLCVLLPSVLPLTLSHRCHPTPVFMPPLLRLRTTSTPLLLPPCPSTQLPRTETSVCCMMPQLVQTLLKQMPGPPLLTATAAARATLPPRTCPPRIPARCGRLLQAAGPSGALRGEGCRSRRLFFCPRREWPRYFLGAQLARASKRLLRDAACPCAWRIDNPSSK
jgi:hypothetical protein